MNFTVDTGPAERAKVSLHGAAGRSYFCHPADEVNGCRLRVWRDDNMSEALKSVRASARSLFRGASDVVIEVGDPGRRA